MSRKTETHVRRLDVMGHMSHADMIAICHRLQEKDKGLIFFAPSAYEAIWPRPGQPGKFDSGYREPLHPLALFQDPESCFLLLRDEQTQHDRAPAIHMSLRVPWPEDEIGNDPMLRRGRLHAALEATDYDDPAFWRRKGRLLDILFPPIEHETEDAFNMRDHRYLQESRFGGFTRAHFGTARVVTNAIWGKLEGLYNVSDPECAAFMRGARSIFSKQMTTRIGYYAPATGEYLGPNKSPYKASCGQELLRWLCHNPTVFLSFNTLYPFAKELPKRLAATGPAPDFKAEIFLEEGLPIDDIEGLSEADKDRLKRRFEKKQKRTAQSRKT